MTNTTDSENQKQREPEETRRQFLRGSGLAVVAMGTVPVLATALSGETVLAAADATHRSNEADPLAGLEDIELADKILRHLKRAIKGTGETPFIDDWFPSRWQQGHDLYTQLQAVLKTNGFRIKVRLVDSPPGSDQAVAAAVKSPTQQFPVDLDTPVFPPDYLTSADLTVKPAAHAAGDVAFAVVRILAECFGIKEFAVHIWNTVNEKYGSIISELRSALARRSRSGVAGALKKLLGKLISKDFMQALAKRVGRSTAAKIVGKIASRFIPIVGWAYMISCIIYLTVKEGVL